MWHFKEIIEEFVKDYNEKNNEDVLIEYINNNSKSKWFKAIDKNLSMEQIVLLNTSLLEFKKQYEVVTTSKCLKKFFATKKAKKLFNKKIKPYFINAWSYQDLIKEVDSILEGLPRYRNIALSYSTISTFSKETLAYGKMVYKISQEEISNIADNPQYTLELMNLIGRTDMHVLSYL